FKKVELGDPKGKVIPVDIVNTTITVSSVPPCDVNADGSVNIFDLILVAQAFGQEVKTRVDTNGDGVINIFDLIVVAQCFGQGAAPAIVSQPVAMFAMVENWVRLAEAADDGSVEFDQGIAVLKEILSSIKPAETVLMPNYPNPFNPETWIPYHLSQDAEVVVRIYDVRGRIVRTLDMGFQSFGYYASRDKAAYWNGKTDIGETVSSGTYFYQIQAGDYTDIRKMVILK
ncbi:TPA: T9SS type A sorting domain-containing protein, partial [Candidatus Poribacteria bacterium]|nr:T9SS type A sorting domain-containing protein [Candidatus Poribacteria bacterium]